MRLRQNSPRSACAGKPAGHSDDGYSFRVRFHDYPRFELAELNSTNGLVLNHGLSLQPRPFANVSHGAGTGTGAGR